MLSAAESVRPPNFLLVLADDLGYMDIGPNNPDTFYDTPNISSLAAQGMRFTNAYAASPVCSPTRASILTGKYPARLGITDYIDQRGANQPENWRRQTAMLPAGYVDHLSHEEFTVAEALKEAGYATFFAGKWHLGAEKFWPEEHGFDVNRGGTGQGGPYGGNKYFSPYNNPRLENGPVGEHLPDRLANEAVAFIEEHRADPFFVFLSFYSVHTPLMARRDLEQKYRQRAAQPDVWGQEGDNAVRQVQNHAVYAGMVEALDSALGKVLQTLVASNLADNTVVIFVSDNGGLSTSHGHPTANFPLRAGKGWLFEGGIRVPLIASWPGVTRPGSVSPEPVITPDLYPTILEMAGIAIRPAQQVDGVSLVPLLRGAGTLGRKAVYWHFPHYANTGGGPGAAVRAGDWKLIQFFEDDKFELYNVRDDVGERSDLADSNPEKVQELSGMLRTWQAEMQARFPERIGFLESWWRKFRSFWQ